MQASSAYFNLFAVMARQSPLNALRQICLSAEELQSLAIICRAINHTDFADLVQAEADLRRMLERRKRREKCLN